MKARLRAAAISAILAGAAMQANAQPYTPPPLAAAASTLSLPAFGEVRVAPDMATISLGVTTEAASAAEAARANAERMTQVVAALRRQGVAERDIQTSGLNLNPQYVYEPNQPPRLTGYQTSNMVTIRVMDLSRLGPAIVAAVNSGANQMQGVSFALREPGRAEDEARRRAVQAVQAKAAVYGQATGYRLGRLVNLSEGGGYAAPPPMPVMARMEMAKDAGTPVSPGEIVVRIDVNAVYELVR